eukprot:Pompholyxophrys_sp_v1_NODE_26_length_3750_cov_7.232206.p6 type:complete len:107 gc:universal NODE_26_length_3750_cov_7.232206:2894-2574(-)
MVEDEGTGETVVTREEEVTGEEEQEEERTEEEEEEGGTKDGNESMNDGNESMNDGNWVESLSKSSENIGLKICVCLIVGGVFECTVLLGVVGICFCNSFTFAYLLN